MKTVIPIVILTHSNPRLDFVLDKLFSRTLHPFDLYIVNNNSKSNLHCSRLSELHKYYDFKVLNCSNRWVLSLNHPTIQNVFDNSPFFVISDDDCV